MDSREFSKYGHVFRPGPFRRKRAFWLNGAILHWRVGDLRGHVPLAEIVDMAVHEGFAGRRCILAEAGGRRHIISERHWFGWEKDERRRIGESALHGATFDSLVSALRWRMKKT